MYNCVDYPRCNYRPRGRGDNAFGSVHVFVCLWLCDYVTRVFFSRSIQNGWEFKLVVVSTGCAIAVDHAFNSGSIKVVRFPRYPLFLTRMVRPLHNVHLYKGRETLWFWPKFSKLSFGQMHTHRKQCQKAVNQPGHRPFIARWSPNQGGR